jgi:hypothetical protein
VAELLGVKPDSVAPLVKRRHLPATGFSRAGRPGDPSGRPIREVAAQHLDQQAGGNGCRAEQSRPGRQPLGQGAVVEGVEQLGLAGNDDGALVWVERPGGSQLVAVATLQAHPRASRRSR